MGQICANLRLTMLRVCISPFDISYDNDLSSHLLSHPISVMHIYEENALYEPGVNPNFGNLLDPKLTESLILK